MLVALAMAFNIIMWSFYPLASLQTLDVLNPFSLMLAVQLVAYFGALIFSILALSSRGQLREYAYLQHKIGLDGILTLIAAGACSAFSHVFFILALTMANKGGVSILFEAWPIIALFLAPHLIEKDWKQTTWKDYMIGAIALVGVAIIILSDEEINWLQNQEWDFYTFFAYVLALLASYMTALLVTLRTNYAQKLDPLKNSFASVMISETIVRLFASIFLAVVGIFLGFDMSIESSQWPVILFIGVGIFALGGSAYTYALLRAKNPNIVIFDYLVPILAVVWLIMAGYTDLTLWLAVGSIITIGACVYLSCKNLFEKADPLNKGSASS